MAHHIIYICIILIFLAGLGFIEHLTWKECLRLFLIQIGLMFLYIKFRVHLEIPNQKVSRPNKSDKLHSGSIVVALVVSFVISQFDPATSSASFGEPGGRLNPFFIISTVLSCAAFSTFAIARGRELRFRYLTSLDRVASVVIFGTIGMSLGSKQLLGYGISGSDLLAQVKILSFLLIWFAVTRSFSDPEWKGLPVQDGRFAGILADRWKGTLIAVSLIFVPALMYGIYRTGAVVYHYKIGQEFFQTEELEAGRQHFEVSNKLNRTVDLRQVRVGCLSDLAVINLKQGDDKAGREMIAELRGAIYNKAEANRKVGDVYFKVGMWAEMSEAYEAFIGQAGKDIEVLDRLGEAYMHQGNSRGFLNMVRDYQYMPQVVAGA